MDRKFYRRLQSAFAKRGGTFGMAPDAPPELAAAMLAGLLECPDCRPAVLEACKADDGRNVDIDAVVRGLVMRGNH